jgi:hypothetical protein
VADLGFCISETFVIPAPYTNARFLTG